MASAAQRAISATFIADIASFKGIKANLLLLERPQNIAYVPLSQNTKG
jgi:hypothetical protein